MKELWLEVHGEKAVVRCCDPSVLDALGRDFEYFSAAPGGPGALQLTLEAREASGEGAGGLPIFGGRDYHVRARGRERVIRYRDGALALYDFEKKKGRIIARDPARLHELAYLALLSRVGEALDRRGLHRVHALGFEWSGHGGLLLLPSGGGKSALTLEMLRGSAFGLLSEDTPIVDSGGGLRAFPLRLGFRPGTDLAKVPLEWQRPFRRRLHGPKTLVDLPFFLHRVRALARPRWLLLGRRGPGPARLRPASRARAAAALGANLVVGVGVAQMAEYMIRPSARGVWDLLNIVASRARAARSLLGACQAWEFSLGAGPEDAARALSHFLASAD